MCNLSQGIKEQAYAEGTLRSRTGSFGNKPDQMMEYEILVHKKDYEKVRGKF